MAERDVWPSTELGKDELQTLRQRHKLIVDPQLELGGLTDALDDLSIDWSTVRLAPIFAGQGTAIEITIQELDDAPSWRAIAREYRAKLMGAWADLARQKGSA